MKKSFFSTFIIILTLSGLTLSGSVQARMKCWTNNEGVKECGNAVPPEYAQKGHEELGKSGVVREETERAKTDKELDEQKRLDAIKAEEERIAAEQKKKDDVLLQTFSSVEDIERARDERLTSLDAAIKLTQARNEKIEYDLDKRIQNAAAAERAGKAPSESLLDAIESLKRQLKNNDSFIEAKRAEQEVIKEAHAKDIAHFKKLKGIK
ncbi:MAG: hypothetical protein HND53_09005 [Proteobacteria bacterium]|nr:hypothetical protein [Pseudomonadota bacterium]NOG60623.1 hypothetical protein [Pseudomonadota bacterium]